MTPSELKAWRAERGMSQMKLAAVLNVNMMTVSNWERGTRTMPSYLQWTLDGLEQQFIEGRPIMLQAYEEAQKPDTTHVPKRDPDSDRDAAQHDFETFCGLGHALLKRLLANNIRLTETELWELQTLIQELNSEISALPLSNSDTQLALEQIKRKLRSRTKVDA